MLHKLQTAGRRVGALRCAATRQGIEQSLALQGWLSRPAAAEDDSIEEGSTTVEYAIGAIATAGFAALLIAVLKSGGIKTLLTNIIQSALSL